LWLKRLNANPVYFGFQAILHQLELLGVMVAAQEQTWRDARRERTWSSPSG
jgi:hypothetical protein